jgi:hypothetical protein
LPVLQPVLFLVCFSLQWKLLIHNPFTNSPNHYPLSPSLPVLTISATSLFNQFHLIPFPDLQIHNSSSHPQSPKYHLPATLQVLLINLQSHQTRPRGLLCTTQVEPCISSAPSFQLFNTAVNLFTATAQSTQFHSHQPWLHHQRHRRCPQSAVPIITVLLFRPPLLLPLPRPSLLLCKIKKE